MSQDPQLPPSPSESPGKTCQVISYGGSGLKYLAAKLEALLPGIYDPDLNPHAPYRPEYKELMEKNYNKIVVVYADPREALLSFWRRSNKNGNWFKMHLAHLKAHKYGAEMGDYDLLDLDRFLLYYTSADRSFTALDDFFFSWYNADLRVPRCFVRYETLQDQNNINELAAFLGIDAKDLGYNLRMGWRERHSSVESLTGPNRFFQVTRLKEMFEDLLAFQNTLPDVEIVGG